MRLAENCLHHWFPSARLSPVISISWVWSGLSIWARGRHCLRWSHLPRELLSTAWMVMVNCASVITTRQSISIVLHSFSINFLQQHFSSIITSWMCTFCIRVGGRVLILHSMYSNLGSTVNCNNVTFSILFLQAYTCSNSCLSTSLVY